jgi:cobalt-precorrin 5A hydrolase
MMKLAIYAITRSGAAQAVRLKRGLPFSDLFVADVGRDACAAQFKDAQLLTRPLGAFVAERFNDYDGHILICAAGIVSRVIAPLLHDKRSDPAVVCVDEQATFAIAMLSGHRGGANYLAERVAHLVKATPVITTASEVSGTLAVDMLGAPFGWVLDPSCEEAVTCVAAAVVNHKPVAIVQCAGEPNWWTRDKSMPRHLISHDRLADLDADYFAGALLVSDALDPYAPELNAIEPNDQESNSPKMDAQDWQHKLVLWRPKSLVLGVGCDRNTPLAVLQAGLVAFSCEFNLALDSVAAIASIDLKADELGLLQLSAAQQWPFHTFKAAQLDELAGVQNPSDYVKKVTGSNSVAEASALKLSQTTQLLVPKWTFKQDGFNITIACCRKTFAEPLIQQKRKNWFGKPVHGSERRHGEPQAIAVNDPPVNDLPVIDPKVSVQSITHNALGNEVVPGYQCKPKHVDLDRPMLHYRHHILLCEGARCAKVGAKNLAHDLRSLLKNMGLASGERRIKISRTLCVGACRNRATIAIYERQPQVSERQPKVSVNNGVWLRGVDDFSETQWRELFLALADDKPITPVVESRYLAPIEGFYLDARGDGEPHPPAHRELLVIKEPSMKGLATMALASKAGVIKAGLTKAEATKVETINEKQEDTTHG